MNTEEAPMINEMLNAVNPKAAEYVNEVVKEELSFLVNNMMTNPCDFFDLHNEEDISENEYHNWICGLISDAVVASIQNTK